MQRLSRAVKSGGERHPVSDILGDSCSCRRTYYWRRILGSALDGERIGRAATLPLPRILVDFLGSGGLYSFIDFINFPDSIRSVRHVDPLNVTIPLVVEATPTPSAPLPDHVFLPRSLGSRDISVILVLVIRVRKNLVGPILEELLNGHRGDRRSDR